MTHFERVVPRGNAYELTTKHESTLVIHYKNAKRTASELCTLFCLSLRKENVLVHVEYVQICHNICHNVFQHGQKTDLRGVITTV